MSKLEILTPEQEVKIAEYREEYLSIGRRAGMPDKQIVAECLREIYSWLDKPAPQVYIAHSWLEAYAVVGLLRRDNIGANIRANIRDNIWANIWDNIWDNIRANIGANIRANIGANIWDNIGANIWDNIRDNIWDNIWDNIGANIRANIQDNIGANIWANIGANIRANIRANIGANIWDNIGAKYIPVWVWGNNDVSWIAYYKYFVDIIRLPGLEEETRKLNKLDVLSRSSGWVYTFEGLAIAVARPSVRLDERGRLHSDDGLALEYPDGVGFHAWRGVRVPKDIIETPETITPERIVNEPNAEIRRVMMFKYGLDRCLDDLGAKLLQADGYGDLYEFEMPEGKQRFVKVIDAVRDHTGKFKEHIIPVLSEHKTAHEAVAWTYNRTPATYQPEFRT